jgi:DnaJ-class molecular chaperone
MTSRVTSIREAYSALGLMPGDGPGAAKSAFRALVKMLHPDIAPPTPATLARLADIVAAMELIKAAGPACLEIEIDSTSAATGLTRTLRSGERPILVRIPAGIRDGEQIAAVGEPDILVTIRVHARSAPQAEPDSVLAESADLDAFIHEYSRPSAHARLARWIRKAQSAA